MAFVCMSPTFILEPEEDRTDLQDDVLKAALNSVSFENAENKLVLTQPGGGVTAPGLGRDPEMAVVGPFVAVLSGSLQNYAYLVRKFCLDDLALHAAISLEAIRERTPIREAALICKLYERLGTGMLTKLRGEYAFCLYDSSTRRVLAARDPSGQVPLCSGTTESGMFFFASGESRPVGHRGVTEIEPGQFVYGWGTSPKKYANPVEEVEKHANEAVGAAAMALKGIKLKPDIAKKNDGRRSLDSLRTKSVDNNNRGRRKSVDAKSTVSPDAQGWHKPKGAKKQRGNSNRNSHESERPHRISQEMNRARSSDSHGSSSSSNNERKKTAAKPSRKSTKKAMGQKKYASGSVNPRADCSVAVTPVH